MTELTALPKQTSSAALERYLAGPSRWSSVGHYDGLLILRSRVEPAVQDAFVIPATPDPWLVLMTGGERQVAVRDGRRWRSARSGPGHVAVTSPGRVTEIRWRSESATPIETFHLHIDAGLFRRVAREAECGDPESVEVRDTLAESDPLIEQVGNALLRELRRQTMLGRLFADAAAHLLSVHILER